MIKWEDIVSDPKFPEDEEEQNKLKLRYWENVISKDPEFPTDIKEQEELKNRFFGTVAPAKPTGGATLTTLPPKYKIQSLSLKEDYTPKFMQDIAKIMPKTEEPKPTMGAEHIPAKVYSTLLERPFAAMGEPISWALEKGFKTLGLNKMADTQKGVTELYKKPPVTEKVQQQTAYLRQEAYKESSFKGITFDITEGVTQLMGLLTQIGIAKKLPGLQGQDIYSHFKVMAGHAVATTPGDLPERLQAAMFRMAYSMTPFIANWTGATGLTAVATDTALNVFLTSPVYRKAWKEAENPEEFFQMAIPQLVMDIGMAWNTRGLPANQARAMYTRYLKAEDRMIKMEVKDFQKLAEDLKLKTEGKAKLEPKILPEVSLPAKPETKPEVPKIPKELKGKTLKEIIPYYNWGEDVYVKKYGNRTLDSLTLKETNELIENAKSWYTSGSSATSSAGEKLIEVAFIHKGILEAKKGKPITEVKPEVKTKEEIYAEKYDIPLEKVKITELPKADVTTETVSEKTIEKLEALVGKPITPKEVLGKVKEAVEPRIGEKETLLESETGAMYVPSAKDFKDVDTKLKGIWDVQAPFVKIGANETGFQLKNYFSQVGWGQEKGVTAIKDIVKLGTKNKLTPDDFTEATFATESLKYKLQMNPELRTKIEPIVKKVNTFYKEWERRLKDIGWLEEPFPKSLISRNDKNIESYRKQLKLDLSKTEKTKIENEIKALQEQNKRIEDLDLSFVSVPIRMILGSGDTAIGKHFMSILPHWGRKTITIKDLVDKGVLTREQADIRSILGEYSDRMSRKYALGKIFKSAEEDGLIARASEKPEWVEFTAKIVPQLKGKVLNPAFNDMLTSYFGAIGRGMGLRGTYQNFIGLTKMMQFYNPLFLPMYDVIQGAMAGTFTSKGTPKNIVKGFRDSITRSKDYWEAFENGLFSKPFTLPFERYEAKLNDVVKPNTLKKLGLKAANVYQLSWNTAWKLDEIVRLMTYNNLKDKGMSARDAAQTAAMFHADYASVPPATRKVLNQIFFTPTFKICMTKLYGSMLKGVARTVFHPTTVETKDKTYAKGLITGFAMMEGIEFFFNQLGYETEEKYRKYVRRVQTDEGMKESVITVSNPMNVPWRYYYRAKSALEPSDLNKLEQIASQAKWELTPVYRVAVDVVQNRYQNVYNPLDNAENQLTDTTKYIIGELVAITKGAFETTKEKEFKTTSFDVLQKELGTLNTILLEPFIFHYVRNIKEVTLQRKIRTFSNETRQILRYTKDPEKKRERLINYYKKLQELFKQF